jgi:tRNA (guanine-N7-)-methyltransferase
MNEAPRRPIRSFVRRAGRQTAAQERALRELLPAVAVPTGTGWLDLDAMFGRQAPRILEIGFGNGDALVAAAATYPDRDYLGAEVHAPGVGHCLLALEKAGLGNVRIAMQDAVELLTARLPPGSLHGVHLYFPDPWHKKRHHKRRLVQPPFAALLAGRLDDGGYFHVATDWPDYALQIKAVFAAESRFRPQPAPAERPVTRFERRGQRLGHPIWEAHYARVS